MQTHSIVANTTVMVFQLESHRVPERYREEDFHVQVALKVESVESGLVPSNLEMANTASEILSLHYTCIIVFDPFTS